MTWAELRPAFAKRRYPCAERASAHGLIARNNHIPPIDYVWEYQSLAHTREETVCMWMMELVENIATIINNKFGEDVDCQFFLEYTDAQAETYEDKYYETVQALYNAYYTSVVAS